MEDRIILVGALFASLIIHGFGLFGFMQHMPEKNPDTWFEKLTEDLPHQSHVARVVLELPRDGGPASQLWEETSELYEVESFESADVESIFGFKSDVAPKISAPQLPVYQESTHNLSNEINSSESEPTLNISPTISDNNASALLFVPSNSSKNSSSLAVSSATLPSSARGVSDQQGSSAVSAPEIDPWKDYAKVVSKLLRSKKFYPPIAKKLQQQGTVIIEIRVVRNGIITTTRVFKTSGFTTLDNAALQAAQMVESLPPFPENTKEEYRVLHIPYNYSLK